jgi:hypothetical protein
MCYEPSRYKFDLWYERMCKSDQAYQEWLKLDEKWVLCYNGGNWYGNMTTNISKSFNHVLKDVYAMVVSTLVQLIFYRCDSYWVK